MAAEVRDSFRQAMSEMFMGENSENSGVTGMTSTSNRPTTAPGSSMRPGGASPIPTSRTAATVRPTVPSGAPGAAADRPDPGSAEVQFARMNQDMSGFKLGATASDSAAVPAGKSNAPLANSQGERSSYGGPMNKIADQNTTNRMAAVGGTGDRNRDNRGGDTPTPPSSGASAVLSSEAAQPRGAHRTSIIAEGTEITGEVKFGSNAEIYGTLSGKVVSDNDIVTNAGLINGDVVAKNLDMMNAKITGDVATQGDLRLSDSSVLTGDIAASRMDLRGQVKGNAAVKRELNVHSSAKLEGDVEAGSIAIGHGARVRGFINVGTEEQPVADTSAKPAPTTK